MLGLLPTPIDEDFRDALVEVARAHRLPSIAEPGRLAPLVEDLAHAYNDPLLRGLAGVDHRAARFGFSLPRDVQKVAGAVRELVAMGRLRLGEGPLSVLDLGAGFGASHRGLARALDRAGQRGELSVNAVDRDPSTLALMKDLAVRRPREGNVTIRLRTEASAIDDYAQKQRPDVVLLGQVLSELDLERPEEERIERHRAMIARLVGSTTVNGMVVVVEPALRARSRHLQRVREALLAPDATKQAQGMEILAPCLHREQCPLLGRDNDWCHEDLPLDLPPWLVPIARGAGLRREGLTFSYLVIAREGPTLRAHLGEGRGAVRMVSAPLVSKGKREAIVCGDSLRTAPVAPEDPYGERGLRLGRLDREASSDNAAFDEAVRGDLLTIEGAIDEKARIDKSARVTRR